MNLVSDQQKNNLLVNQLLRIRGEWRNRQAINLLNLKKCYYLELKD